MALRPNGWFGWAVDAAFDAVSLSRLDSSDEAVSEGSEVKVPVVLEHFGDEVDLACGRVKAPDDLARCIQFHDESVLGHRLVQDPAVVDP